MREETPEELDVKICSHMARRDKLRDMIFWLEKRIEYRTRRIQALSKQRTEALNFKLPLDAA